MVERKRSNKFGLIFFLNLLVFSHFILAFPLDNKLNFGDQNKESLVSNPPVMLNIAARGWGLLEVVTKESVNNSVSQSFLLDDSGNIHLVWMDRTDLVGEGSDLDVFYRCWNATSGLWTSIEWVSSESTQLGDYRGPSIAIDESGNLHVLWVDRTNINGSGTDQDIFYRCRNASTSSWNPTEVVSINCTKTSHFPQIAMDRMGNIHAVWVDNSEPSWLYDDIFYACRDNFSGTWTSYEVVSQGGSYDSTCPSLVIDASNNIHVSWEEWTTDGGSGNDQDIFYRSLNVSNGNWTSIDVVSTESMDHSYYPKMGISQSGYLHFVWSDISDYNGADSDRDIFYKKLDIASHTWSTTELVTSESQDLSQTGAIAVDEFENVHVVWQEYENFHDNLYYKYRNVSTNQWTDITSVAEECTGHSQYPQIKLDANNYIHLIWQDNSDYNNSGTDFDIFYKKSVWVPNKPVIEIIPPNPSRNGCLTLNWNNITGAIEYFVYRANSPISSVFGMSPIGITSLIEYSDIITTNGFYYYVIVASNASGNSSISNCVWGWVAIPPEPPDLNPISPSNDEDGIIILNWNVIPTATFYYIYRSKEFITSVGNMTPIAQITTNFYQDNITENGGYYYAVVAGNATGTSNISNCVYVNVEIPSSPFIDPLVLVLIIIGIIAIIGSSLFVYTKYFRRSKGTRIKQTPQDRSKTQIKILDKTIDIIPPAPVFSNCPSCGLENRNNLVFCKKCGCELEGMRLAEESREAERQVQIESQTTIVDHLDQDSSMSVEQLSAEIKSRKAHNQIYSCLSCLTLFIWYLFFQWGGEWLALGALVWIGAFLPIAILYTTNLRRIKDLEKLRTRKLVRNR